MLGSPSTRTALDGDHHSAVTENRCQHTDKVIGAFSVGFGSTLVKCGDVGYVDDNESAMTHRVITLMI